MDHFLVPGVKSYYDYHGPPIRQLCVVFADSLEVGEKIDMAQLNPAFPQNNCNPVSL